MKTVGISIHSAISCPPVTAKKIRKIEGEPPEFITRHMAACYLQSALNGYFRFGTTAGYAPKEKVLNPGRLGDVQEGRQLHALKSRYGDFTRISVGKSQLNNVSFVGFEHDAVVQFTANDYCSCSSLGKFDSARAERLKAQDNPDLGAFVTYDVHRIRSAVESILRETAGFSKAKTIGRPVVYGHKDVRWEVENTFTHRKHRDSLATWLGITFVKSQSYEHEEEYRLIISDPKKLGTLKKDTDPLQMNDPRIADAVVASGFF